MLTTAFMCFFDVKMLPNYPLRRSVIFFSNKIKICIWDITVLVIAINSILYILIKKIHPI